MSELSYSLWYNLGNMVLQIIRWQKLKLKYEQQW